MAALIYLLMFSHFHRFSVLNGWMTAEDELKGMWTEGVLS
jgi:hypothetical protein